MIVTCPSCCTRYKHDAATAAPMARARCSRCDESFFLTEPRRNYVLMPTREAVAAPTTAATPAGARLGFGTDDPPVAARLGGTGLDPAGAPPEPLTYRVMVGDDPPAVDLPERADAPAADATYGEITLQSGGAAMDLADPSATQALDSAAVQEALAASVPGSGEMGPQPVEPETLVAADPLGLGGALAADPATARDVRAVAPPPPRRRRRSRPFLEALVALLTTAAGVAVGYHMVFPLPFTAELPFEVPGGLDDVTVVRAATCGLVGMLLGWLCLRRVRPKS